MNKRLNNIPINKSEEHELFSDVADNFVRNNFQHIEVNSLGERSALTNDNNVSFLY